MKLTIFYQKENIDFLFQFTPVSEEYFIEYHSYAVEPDWEAGSDNLFSEKIDTMENCLIILSPSAVKRKWVSYVLGYTQGKKINCHLYASEMDIPKWCRTYPMSHSIEDLVEYYKYYNDRWLESAKIKIAKKTLIDLRKDITLTAFIEVVKEGDCMLAGIYMEAGYIAESRDRNGVPLICWAARSRKLPMIKLLMQGGADINAVSSDRNGTALIDAVSEDDLECVNFLLQYDPDLEVASKNGQTALTIASGHNNVEIVRSLVEKGADMNRKDQLGMSALTYARLQNNSEILEILGQNQ